MRTGTRSGRRWAAGVAGCAIVWVLAHWAMREGALSSTVMALIAACAWGVAQAVDARRPTRPAPGVLDDTETSLLTQGRELDAIRHYRHRTGAGLRAARDAVQGRSA